MFSKQKSGKVLGQGIGWGWKTSKLAGRFLGACVETRIELGMMQWCMSRFKDNMDNMDNIGYE